MNVTLVNLAERVYVRVHVLVPIIVFGPTVINPLVVMLINGEVIQGLFSRLLII